MPVPELFGLYNQLMKAVEDGEKLFDATGSTGRESAMQREALRTRLNSQEQLLTKIRDLIDSKRQGCARFLTNCG